VPVEVLREVEPEPVGEGQQDAELVKGADGPAPLVGAADIQYQAPARFQRAVGGLRERQQPLDVHVLVGVAVLLRAQQRKGGDVTNKSTQPGASSPSRCRLSPLYCAPSTVV
jgi:hypothetical protein